MNTSAAQFIESNKASLKAIESATTQAFAGVQKLVELNLTASKASLGETFSHVQAVLVAKDAQELAALQTSLIKPLGDKSAAYFEQVKNIVMDSTADFTKSFEAKTAEAQKAFAGVIENMTKNAPAGTESAVAAFKNAMSVGQTGIESAQTQAKQAIEIAQTNIEAASTKTVTPVKKVTSKA